MSSDKYSQGGRYAPHRYVNTVNHSYDNVTVESGPSLGCVTSLLIVLTIVISYFVYVY